MEQVAPAAPAYLMALPTKLILVGYLTTCYQDHVRLREKIWRAGQRRDAEVFSRAAGAMLPGNPPSILVILFGFILQYKQRRGDTRPREVLEREAEEQLAAVRRGGCLLHAGQVKQPSELAPQLAVEIRQNLQRCPKSAFGKTGRSDFTDRIPDSLAIANSISGSRPTTFGTPTAVKSCQTNRSTHCHR